MESKLMPAKQYHQKQENRVFPASNRQCCFPVKIDGTTFYGTPSQITLPKCESSREDVYHALLEILKPSTEELKKNGYIFFMGWDRIKAFVKPTQYTEGMWLDPMDKMRKCCRCDTRFELEKNSECIYHLKEKRFDRGCANRICCGEEYGLTDGCQKRQYHVFNQFTTDQLFNKFITTEKPKIGEDSRSKTILAIDAEMVYTVSGPALARLSVVNWDEELIMDCKVRPADHIIDANTEFSGLTIDDVLAHEDTLESCRRKLLELANEKTILVGHSLECDLTALRLIHYNIVDTAILFKKGDRKIGLKKLALEHLGLRIQSNNPNQQGHDSEEDARICLKLLKYKIFH